MTHSDEPPDHHELVTVYYGDKPFDLEHRVYTTEELRIEFSVPDGYVFEVIVGDGEFRELKPNKNVTPHEGMEFVSHAPVGQSS